MKKIFTLFTLLLCVVSSAWAGDYVDAYGNFGAVTGNYVGNGISKIVLGDNAKSSSGIQIEKSKTGTFSVSVPDGFTIKSLQFTDNGKATSISCNDNPSMTLSRNSSTKVNTYTASNNITNVVFTIESSSSSDTKLTNFRVTTTNNSTDDYELITPSGSVSDGIIPFTSSLKESTMVTALASINANSGNSNIDFGNGKGFSIATSRAIKAVYCVWYQRQPSTDNGWIGYSETAYTNKIGTYTNSTNAWVSSDANTKFIAFKRTEGSTAKLSSIHIFYYADLPTYSMVAGVDNETHGTASVSSESVQQGSSVTFTASENSGWHFSKWTNNTGDDVSTDNPYTIENVSSDISLIANFEAATTYTVTITAGETGALGKYYDNTVITQNENTMVTLPEKNSWFYKEGYTAIGWTDGTNDYDFGGSFTLTENVVIYPLFRPNTKAIGDADATVTWSLLKPVSGPIHIEGSTGYLVTTAEVDGEIIDVPMFWDNTSGKVDNRTRTTDCQVNDGSKFTIPAIKGVVVTLSASYAITATLDGSPMTATESSPYTATGIYAGTGNEVEVVINGGSWFQSITAVYKVKYSSPTISSDTDFNFANKGYKVTITASEGSLQVSTDGTTYTEQTSPYVTYATTTTTYYAKATGNDYGDSNVSQQEVTNDFDATKKYVAWVYGTDGNYTQYNPATDKMVIALKEDYNVVAVGSVNTQSPSNDLNNADLIVCSEAMTGNKTFSNGMKVFAGVTPMIGLKAYNYTKGRWSWGTPANPSSTAQSFIPKSKLYKVLKNVSYETDGSIKLATATSGNVIQTVEFGTTDCTAPEGNVIMGTLDNNDANAVMYASNKYFGLGLSCDCRETYTDNAITIIKNAAAMLIAGELMILEPSDPVVEGDVVTLTTTATMAGWRAFYDADNSYTVDENTKVYVAKNENEGKVTLTEYAAGVPAGTPVILKTSAEAETDGTFKMTLTKTTETITPAYTGESLLKVTPFEGNVYRLGSKSGEVGFFPFNATGAAAGIVVLNVDSSNAGARGLGITFDDETTAIHNVKDNMDVNKNVYDLQGRSVAKPTKGLYIVNGKKVVIK